jgi:hypothetical protein
VVVVVVCANAMIQSNCVKAAVEPMAGFLAGRVPRGKNFAGSF